MTTSLYANQHADNAAISSQIVYATSQGSYGVDESIFRTTLNGTRTEV